jgi:hypothetical protein
MYIEEVQELSSVQTIFICIVVTYLAVSIRLVHLITDFGLVKRVFPLDYVESRILF